MAGFCFAGTRINPVVTEKLFAAIQLALQVYLNVRAGFPLSILGALYPCCAGREGNDYVRIGVAIDISHPGWLGY